jgi:hypothetical protein
MIKLDINKGDTILTGKKLQELFLIYETTNLINGKKYRGFHQTKDIGDGYLGSGNSMIKAIKKYGKHNFKKEILEYCITKEDMIEKEKFYVDEEWVNRKDTYNLKTGGIRDFKLSDISCNRIKESYDKVSRVPWNKGRKDVYSEETLFKMSDARVGKSLSNVTKQKIKEKSKYQICTDSTRKKISDRLKLEYKNGSRKKLVLHSKETKEKMSMSQTGRKHSESSILKMRNIHKGKIISTEQREKTSKTLTKERIEILQKCLNCDNVFTLIFLRSSKNTTKYIKRYCSKKCSCKKTNNV